MKTLARKILWKWAISQGSYNFLWISTYAILMKNDVLYTVNIFFPIMKIRSLRKKTSTFYSILRLFSVNFL